MNDSRMFFILDQPTRKKRKSRWGEEEVKTVLPGLPTILPANMKEDEQKLYLSKFVVLGL